MQLPLCDLRLRQWYHHIGSPAGLFPCCYGIQFLHLCEDYGSQRLAVRIVAVGRDTGIAVAPERRLDDVGRP